jgi:hypothetical protein
VVRQEAKRKNGGIKKGMSYNMNMPFLAEELSLSGKQFQEMIRSQP